MPRDRPPIYRGAAQSMTKAPHQAGPAASDELPQAPTAGEGRSRRRRQGHHRRHLAEEPRAASRMVKDIVAKLGSRLATVTEVHHHTRVLPDKHGFLAGRESSDLTGVRRAAQGRPQLSPRPDRHDVHHLTRATARPWFPTNRRRAFTPSHGFAP